MLKQQIIYNLLNKFNKWQIPGTHYNKENLKKYLNVWSGTGRAIHHIPHAEHDETDILKFKETCYNNTYTRYHKPLRDNSPSKILCFGCSNTFGVGLHAEDAWPSILQNNINENVLNCGIPGASTDLICRRIYNTAEREDIHTIFCLFPDIHRQEFFNINGIDIFSMHPSISNAKSIAEEYAAYMKIYNTETAFLNFVKNFKFIELICKRKNINFIWYTWSPMLLNLGNDYLFRFLGEQHNTLLYKDTLYDITVENNLDTPDKRTADGWHNGKLYNEILATKFAEIYKSLDLSL